MTAVEKAYRTAEEWISNTIASGAYLLDLSQHQTRALSILPPTIAEASSLEMLDLSHTRITDITPLCSLTGLKELFLTEAPITDIAPLRSLTGLQILVLHDTDITDLRPLAHLDSLRDGGANNITWGLHFRHSAAIRTDKTLRTLSEIDDDAERTEKTLTYLRSLPEWPEPYTPEGTDFEIGGNEAGPQVLHSGVPAPLRVIEVDDILRPAILGDELDADGNLLARQGWDALREYLSDLADQRERISNSMPRLGTAMLRFEAAMGASLSDVNAIRLGTQGNRVIRLSRLASETLLDEDAADIEEFAAAIALFLERFPEWRDYRDVASTRRYDPDSVREAAKDITDLAEALEDKEGVDAAIAEDLEAQADVVQDDPQEPVAFVGLLGSASNVLSALATNAIPLLKILKREAADVGKMTWSGVKKTLSLAATGSITAIGGTAIDVYINKGKALRTLAEKFPDYFDWLLKFLNAFGL